MCFCLFRYSTAVAGGDLRTFPNSENQVSVSFSPNCKLNADDVDDLPLCSSDPTPKSEFIILEFVSGCAT